MASVGLILGLHIVGAAFVPGSECGTGTPIQFRNKISARLTTKGLECSFVKDLENYREFAKVNLKSKFFHKYTNRGIGAIRTILQNFYKYSKDKFFLIDRVVKGLYT